MADQADLARELLQLAADDLTAARALVDVPAVSGAIVGFHAQQTAEKALKASLAAAGQDFPFTHNIALLMQLCEDAGIKLPTALDTLDLLTPYGVAGRYARVLPIPSTERLRWIWRRRRCVGRKQLSRSRQAQKGHPTRISVLLGRNAWVCLPKPTICGRSRSLFPKHPAKSSI